MRVGGVVDAVVRAGGIEMAAGGGEGRAFAFANRVDMDAVFSGGQAGDLHGDLHAVFSGFDFGGADFGAFGVRDVGVGGFGSGVG